MTIGEDEVVTMAAIVNCIACKAPVSDEALVCPHCGQPRPATAKVEVGQVYEGNVARLMEFGMFVNIAPGSDGIAHKSTMPKEVFERLSKGDTVTVKVLEIDQQGRIKLTMII